MSLAEELAKLQYLRDTGSINDDEFVLAKAKVLRDPMPVQPPPPPAATQAPAPPADVQPVGAFRTIKGLTKSSSDAMIGGVCAGLGRDTPVPTWVWRAGFLTALLIWGFGVVPYIILWICLPADPTVSKA